MKEWQRLGRTRAFTNSETVGDIMEEVMMGQPLSNIGDHGMHVGFQEM